MRIGRVEPGHALDRGFQVIEAAFLDQRRKFRAESAGPRRLVDDQAPTGFLHRLFHGLDIDAIEASVKKTGRCMIVHEATRTSGFGAELSALVQERCFYHLEAPIERVTGFDTPYPHSLEWAYFPGPVRIGQALKKIMKD